MQASIETDFMKRYLWTIVTQLLIWGVPTLWILLIPPKNRALDAQTINDTNIARANKIIELFQKDYRTLPDSMTELKAYSRSKRFIADFYDAYGNPLEYIHLSEDDYIVRSFGRDGDQNTLLQGRDTGGSSFKKTPRETPQYEYCIGPQLSAYPAVLTAGSNSPNKEWYARIFSNFKDGKRRLAVYHKKKRSFFMVARHDSIEEFLWLPSGYALIFSATSSSRYRDGVYYWDLLEDELVNLLTSGSFDANLAIPQSASNEYMISLSGLNMDGSKVYFYLVNKNYGEALNPLDFYSSDALVSATVPINIEDDVKLSQAMPDVDQTLFEQDVFVATTKESESLSLRIQHEWMKLSLDGDVYHNIARWQEFAGKYPQSALLPYSLFFIMNLYHVAYSINTSQSESELAELRGYTGEMAKALSEYPLAPSYLKAMARFTYAQIMKGDPIGFNPELLKVTRGPEKD